MPPKFMTSQANHVTFTETGANSRQALAPSNKRIGLILSPATAGSVVYNFRETPSAATMNGILFTSVTVPVVLWAVDAGDFVQGAVYARNTAAGSYTITEILAD